MVGARPATVDAVLFHGLFASLSTMLQLSLMYINAGLWEQSTAQRGLQVHSIES